MPIWSMTHRARAAWVVQCAVWVGICLMVMLDVRNVCTYAIPMDSSSDLLEYLIFWE
jgi:hypothetical protein